MTSEMSAAIIVSDLHCGCQLGLCPPEGAKLDEGGTYMPNDFQKKTWLWWREFWDEWVPMATRRKPYCVICNGDAIDGRHHDTTTQFSHNLTDQMKLAYQVLIPIVEKCKGRYYHIRGTEAHGGKSGENEEALAKILGAIPNTAGKYARDELWKFLSGEKVLIHLLHHIGTTSSASYELTAVYKELVEAYSEAGRWGDRPPDVVIRSHRHRHAKAEVATANDRGTVVVTPGWQGKTPLTFRINLAKQSQPQFGGVMIRVSEENELYERHYVKRLERPVPE